MPSQVVPACILTTLGHSEGCDVDSGANPSKVAELTSDNMGMMQPWRAILARCRCARALFGLLASHMWRTGCKCQTLPSCSHMQGRSSSHSARVVSGSFSSCTPGLNAALYSALPSLNMLCTRSALLTPEHVLNAECLVAARLNCRRMARLAAPASQSSLNSSNIITQLLRGR
jgi:hypothetical protein